MTSSSRAYINSRAIQSIDRSLGDDPTIADAIVSAMEVDNEICIWVAPKHDDIKMINEAYLTAAKASGKQIFRIIANHVGKNIHVPKPDKEMENVLYSLQGSRKGGMMELSLTHMDLYVGCRVRITDNIFVEGGLFNGAMGTVMGFVYATPPPQSTDAALNGKFSELKDIDKEIPVVLVQLDGDDSSHNWSCSNKIKRLVPIVACIGSSTVSKTDYKRVQLPLRVAHARTGHSSQGLTAHCGVVVLPGSSYFGGDYVAISRGKCLSDVIMLDYITSLNFSAQPKFRDKIDRFYKCMRKKFNK